MLSGACGHTYGANGIWQVNQRDQPFGPSPHGLAWGHTPWDEAALLPGSAHVAVGKRLLERYAWWQFQPHPEWVQPHWTPENYVLAYAAGIAGQVRVIYLPVGVWPPTVKDIEPKADYRAFLFDPTHGDEYDLGQVEVDANGDWTPSIPRQPIFQDWVLVLEKR